MTAEPRVAPWIASCDYTGEGRSAQLLLFDERADVAGLLAARDCRSIAVPAGDACAFEHPLGAEGTGAGLVVRTAGGVATLSVEGDPPTADQLVAAAVQLADVLVAEG
jgi:hypothetical protein